MSNLNCFYMDKIKIKENVIELDVQDFSLLLGSILRERFTFQTLLENCEPIYKKYYSDRIRRCDDLVDKFSECI